MSLVYGVQCRAKMPEQQATSVIRWSRAAVAFVLVVITFLVVAQRRFWQYTSPLGEEPSFTKLAWIATPDAPNSNPDERPRRLVHQEELVPFDPVHAAPRVPRSPPR